MKRPDASYAPFQITLPVEALFEHPCAVAVGHYEAAEHEEEDHTHIAAGREHVEVVKEDEDGEDAPQRLQRVDVCRRMPRLLIPVR